MRQSWDACTRLLAAIILYYNTYILNRLYERTSDPQAKEFLLRTAPTAWDNINLLGRYQFHGDVVFDIDQWIHKWNWHDEMVKLHSVQNREEELV